MKIFAIEPVPEPRMTQSDRWNSRPCVMRYFAFKDAMRLAVNRNRFEVAPGVSIRFVLSMPDSWSKKKKLKMNGQPHEQKPDIDNLLKAFFDALLEDDCKIWKVGPLEKIWGEKGRIEIL